MILSTVVSHSNYFLAIQFIRISNSITKFYFYNFIDDLYYQKMTLHLSNKL
jgi:hypothetical protein